MFRTNVCLRHQLMLIYSGYPRTRADATFSKYASSSFVRLPLLRTSGLCVLLRFEYYGTARMSAQRSDCSDGSAAFREKKPANQHREKARLNFAENEIGRSALCRTY